MLQMLFRKTISQGESEQEPLVEYEDIPLGEKQSREHDTIISVFSVRKGWDTDWRGREVTSEYYGGPYVICSYVMKKWKKLSIEHGRHDNRVKVVKKKTR